MSVVEWIRSSRSIHKSSVERLTILFHASKSLQTNFNSSCCQRRDDCMIASNCGWWWWRANGIIVSDKGQTPESLNHLCTSWACASNLYFEIRLGVSVSSTSYTGVTYNLDHNRGVDNAIDLQSRQIWVRSMGASEALMIGFRCVARQWVNITLITSIDTRRIGARIVLQSSIDFWTLARFRLRESRTLSIRSISTSILEIFSEDSLWVLWFLELRMLKEHCCYVGNERSEPTSWMWKRDGISEERSLRAESRYLIVRPTWQSVLICSHWIQPKCNILQKVCCIIKFRTDENLSF